MVGQDPDTDLIMDVILLSANNNGAGKTTYAKNLERFIQELKPNTYVYRMPLANFAKEHFSRSDECYNYFPHLDVYSDEFKKHTALGKSGRQFLKDFAEKKCCEDPLVWCNEWMYEFNRFKSGIKDRMSQVNSCTIIVEDIRKAYELAFFRQRFNNYKIQHKHFISELGEYDGTFPDTKINGILERLADKIEHIYKE